MHSELFLFYRELFIGDLLRNRKANLSLGGPKSVVSTYRVFAEPDVNDTDYIETAGDCKTCNFFVQYIEKRKANGELTDRKGECQYAGAEEIQLSRWQHS